MDDVDTEVDAEFGDSIDASDEDGISSITALSVEELVAEIKRRGAREVTLLF